MSAHEKMTGADDENQLINLIAALTRVELILLQDYLQIICAVNNNIVEAKRTPCSKPTVMDVDEKTMIELILSKPAMQKKNKQSRQFNKSNQVVFCWEKNREILSRNIAMSSRVIENCLSV